MIGVFLLVCVSICLPSAGLHAETVYTWRDRNGDLHITDTPPPARTEGVETVHYTAPPADPARTSSEPDDTGKKPSADDASGPENAEISLAEARALEAREKADDALRKQKELLGRLGRNKKMRRRNRYKLSRAAAHAEAMEKQAQEAERQLTEARQRLAGRSQEE